MLTCTTAVARRLYIAQSTPPLKVRTFMCFAALGVCGANVNLRDGDGNTALHEVFRHSWTYAEIATHGLELDKHLVQTRRADIESTDNYGRTILHVACCCSTQY
jgi:ankyrin repeat protein